MFSRDAKISLLVLLVLVGAVNVSYAKKKKSSHAPPQVVPPPPPCTPRVGIVIPEFIVFQSPDTEVEVTVWGTCLNTASFAPRTGLTATLTSPVLAGNSPPPYKLVYGVKFPKEGRYTVCVGNDATCSNGGPAIQVVGSGACGPVAGGEAPIIDLQSEIPLPETTPPIAASCALPSNPADKVIVVDANSSRMCEADDPNNPNAECLNRLLEKKPLYLERGDTVSVSIVNKNPFRETYKFSSTDNVIKDDDIGSFLALLVPSLGGGSGTQPSTGGSDKSSNAADTAGKTVDSLNTMSTDLSANIQKLQMKKKLPPEDVVQIDKQVHSLKTQELQAYSELNHLQDLQETERHILPPERAATVDSLHQSADTKLKESFEKISKVGVAHPKPETADEKSVLAEYQSYKEALQPLASARDQLKQAQNIIQSRKEKIASCSRTIQQRVDTLVLNYRYFASTYNEVRNQLVSSRQKNSPAYCANFLNNATGLWELLTRENEKILNAQIDLNLRDAISVTTPQKQARTKSTVRTSAMNAQAGSTGNPTGDSPANDPSSDGGANNDGIKSSVCFMKALHAQVSPALSGNIAVLETVLANPDSLVSSFQIGPYADPTQVDWTLTRTVIKPSISGISISEFNSAIDDCINPPPAKPDTSSSKDVSANLTGSGIALSHSRRTAAPPQPHLRNASFNPGDFVVAYPLSPEFAVSSSGSQKSAKKTGSKSDSPTSASTSGGDKSSNDKSSDNKSSAQTSSSGDDSGVTTRGRRINFGKERFIVSIGAVWAHLSQQNIGTGLGIPQFDASGNPPPPPPPPATPTPTPATTIITQTNHSSFRISPMAFLNTRLFDWNRWNEPLYFTFGITAKSSDTGVKPEYLLGFSQSLAERHLFVTGGVYIGQQTSLAGNLKINQQVPAGFTGSPPVNSVYSPGFTLGLSWRVPGLAK